MRSLPAAALALLIACSSPAPIVPTPTAAPEPTLTPPTAPTRAPDPTPVAEPTAAALRIESRQMFAIEQLSSDLQRAFSAARQRMFEGDYARAADAWRQLMQAALPAEATTEVRFELALALARDARGADALQVLQTPPPQPDSREDFIRGIALDAAQARQLKQRLLEVRAQALAALGDHEAAFDAHRQVLALATSNATLGEQLFRLAEVSRDLGKRDEAVRALKTALDQFPGASTTADALRLLDELGAADEVDPFVLGRARYFAVDYRNAVTAFDRYLRVDPNGPDVPL